MDSNSLLSGLLGLGIIGLLIAILLWIIATVITGYFLGVGIWAARPRSMRLYNTAPSASPERADAPSNPAATYREAVRPETSIGQPSTVATSNICKFCGSAGAELTSLDGSSYHKTCYVRAHSEGRI